MTIPLLFFSALTLLVSLSSQTADPKPPNPTRSPSLAHTELTRFGFPIGLLPSPVENYTVNPLTGDFVVDLGDACKITLPPDNYLATYSKSHRQNQPRPDRRDQRHQRPRFLPVVVHHRNQSGLRGPPPLRFLTGSTLLQSPSIRLCKMSGCQSGY
ncbi:hypothetical protein ACLB2K_000458 [Fragaria x ananassa]